jgi:hypothetical protein
MYFTVNRLLTYKIIEKTLGHFKFGYMPIMAARTATSPSANFMYRPVTTSFLYETQNFYTFT